MNVIDEMAKGANTAFDALFQIFKDYFALLFVLSFFIVTVGSLVKWIISFTQKEDGMFVRLKDSDILYSFDHNGTTVYVTKDQKFVYIKDSRGKRYIPLCDDDGNNYTIDDFLIKK